MQAARVHACCTYQFQSHTHTHQPCPTPPAPQLHQQPPYSLHMVYLLGGFTSKVHHIREAMLAAEPPEYYRGPKLLSFSLSVDPVPMDFNSWPNVQHSHEEMIQRHLRCVQGCGGLAVAVAAAMGCGPLLRACGRPWYVSARQRQGGGCGGVHVGLSMWACPCGLGLSFWER
jgi:hypothetical protein